MILLHRALHKDSRSTRFANLQIFYEFLLNFKVHCKNNKEALAATIHLSHGLFKYPPGFSFLLNPRSLAGSEGGRWLTGQIPARGSPAARGKRSGSFTGSKRTSGWSWGAGRGSEAAVRRSRAAAAEVPRRLGCSGEDLARRGGRGAERAHGGAR